MPGGKWYSSIKCFRISFVILLLFLAVAGVVIYTQTNISSFIGIILIATPCIVLLAVIALSINSYCHYHFSHSLNIHGVTDGLEFDEVDLTALYSNRSSRRTSLTTMQHRHSIDPNSPIFDLLPDDNSDVDEQDNHDSPNENFILTTLQPDADENTGNYRTPHTVVDVIEEENEETEEAENFPENNESNRLLPTYEDAVSNYGGDEEDSSAGTLPTYQEAVLREETEID